MLNLQTFEKLWLEICRIRNDDYNSPFSERGRTWEEKVEHYFKEVVHPNHPAIDSQRFHDEVFGFGPLEILLKDSNITEILVNDLNQIWYERQGHLEKHLDRFYSKTTYNLIVDRLCKESKAFINTNHPFADAHFQNFRLTIVGSEVTGTCMQISLRRHPENPWTLESLAATSWATPQQISMLKSIVTQRKNFLVVGGTSSGKTSITNALLNEIPKNQRVLVIEDAPEIQLPNPLSARLLTRIDPQGELPEINQGHLVKRALRLRPDRIILGEIRGEEAKDLLMALATGHSGSLSTLHAADAAQALIRLEMLIQMGAPQWSLQAVRRLIQMSIDGIIVTEKTAEGTRRLKGIYKISSLEDCGFLIDPL